MKISKTSFEGLVIIEPDIFKDQRGYFFESYNRKSFLDAGIDMEFVQDNQSKSAINVIRGLHFQRPPYAQAKLIRVLEGKILDVAVDLRKDHPTFRSIFTFELSAQDKLQILIPKGFAHGFSVLSDGAEILYKCDENYYPEYATGVIYNDPELAIDWRIEMASAVISPKDLTLPTLSQLTF